MITFDANQNTIIGNDYITYSWLFTITQGVTTYRLSTKEYSYGGQTYFARIIANQFNGGPQEQRMATEAGSLSPFRYSFAISNTTGSYSASFLEGAEVLLRLVCSDGTLEEVMRQWKMTIPSGGAKELYDKIEIEAVSYIQDVAKGEWPNRPLVKDIYPSSDSRITWSMVTDNMCVPITIGTSYIPVRSVYTGVLHSGRRYYLLGLNSGTDTYTLTELRAPRGRGDSIYSSGTYNFNQYDAGSYRVMQPIIADSDSDGDVDASGIWYDSGSGTLLDPLLKYRTNRTGFINGSQVGTATATDGTGVTLTYSGTQLPANSVAGCYVVNRTTSAYGLITSNSGAAKTITCSGGLSSGGWTSGNTYTVGGPASVIRFVLTDSTDGMGVSTSNIDDDLFGAAEVTYAGWGLIWYHGFFVKRNREELMTDLLCMCHSIFTVRDKIGLKVLSKTSQKTFTNFIKGSFNYNKLEPSANDSAYFAFIESGEPADVYIKAIVPAGTTSTSPASDVFECYLIEDSDNAKELAHLRLQRKFLKDAKYNFKHDYSSLAIEPGDIITVNNAYYGESSFNCMIETMHINKDLVIEYSGYSFTSSIDDFGDKGYSAVSVSDTSGETVTPWKAVYAGSDDDNGNNVIPGRLRLTGSNNDIIIDPDDPSITLNELVGETTNDVVKIGNINAGVIGIHIKNSAGDIVFIVDDTPQANIAGWEITTTKLTSGDLELDADNTKIVAGAGTNIITIDAEDETYRLAIGDSVYADAPFRVTRTGVMTAIGAVINGTITITGGTGITNLDDAGGLATADDVDYDTQVTGDEKPDNNATVGAEFGVNISGGGAGANQVGNDGTITQISGGIITTGTLNALLCNVTNINATNINAGTLNVDRISANSIVTEKLSFKDNPNLLRDIYSTFEHYHDGDNVGAGVANGTATCDGDNFYIGSRCLKMNATSADNYVYLGQSSTDYNIPIKPSTRYIISFYAKGASGNEEIECLLRQDTTVHKSVTFTSNNNSESGNTTADVTTAWLRYYGYVNTDAGITDSGLIRFDNNDNGAVVRFDAVMIEEVDAANTQPSPYSQGVSIANSITTTKIFSVSDGDYVISYYGKDGSESPSEYLQTAMVYTKIFEVRVPLDGTYTTYFNLKRHVSDSTAYGRIYVNGVAVGTARSTSSTSYQYYDEDIVKINAGDLVQLYTYCFAGAGAYTNVFRVSCDTPLESIFTEY